MGDEKVETVFPVVKSLYEWIGGNVCGALVLGRNITIYKVHDCKILYNLLQCSMWNRANYPFALCDCLKGRGVIYPDHACTFITDEEHPQGGGNHRRRANVRREKTTPEWAAREREQELEKRQRDKLDSIAAEQAASALAAVNAAKAEAAARKEKEEAEAREAEKAPSEGKIADAK